MISKRLVKVLAVSVFVMNVPLQSASSFAGVGGYKCKASYLRDESSIVETVDTSEINNSGLSSATINDYNFTISELSDQKTLVLKIFAHTPRNSVSTTTFIPTANHPTRLNMNVGDASAMIICEANE